MPKAAEGFFFAASEIRLKSGPCTRIKAEPSSGGEEGGYFFCPERPAFGPVPRSPVPLEASETAPHWCRTEYARLEMRARAIGSGGEGSDYIFSANSGKARRQVHRFRARQFP